MNFFAFNLLGARVAPFVFMALIGLELADISWQLLPEPNLSVTSMTTVADKQVEEKNHAISLAAVLESLRVFNPWEKPEELPTKPPPPEVKQVVVDSNLELNLIGAMILPQTSWAILTRKKDVNRQIVLQVGEDVDGATLKKIEREAVYFDNHGRLERIVMQDKLTQDQLGADGSIKGMSSAAIQSLSRSEYEGLLSKGMGLLAGVNITPFYTGKESIGYQVRYPESKEEFKKVGLESNDVIQKVNGISVLDTSKITQLSNQLRAQSTLRIELMRNNQPQTIEINIEN